MQRANEQKASAVLNHVLHCRNNSSRLMPSWLIKLWIARKVLRFDQAIHYFIHTVILKMESKLFPFRLIEFRAVIKIFVKLPAREKGISYYSGKVLHFVNFSMIIFFQWDLWLSSVRFIWEAVYHDATKQNLLIPKVYIWWFDLIILLLIAFIWIKI